MVRSLKRPIRLELMGAMATANPFILFDSSSRLKMLAAHLDQACSPNQADIPISLTGLETQLRAFDIRMPCDGVVVSVHNKFRKSLDAHAVKGNPLMTVIFQNQEPGGNGEYDYVDIYEYHSKHRVYGVKYRLAEIVSKIRPGFHIRRDTILAHSPNILDGGIYSNSLTCNVVNLSIPSTIEDGFAVSESFAERGALQELHSIVGQWGKKYYPLNTYGDENHFKPYPDIGDTIREDGLVFALREYNENFDALEMSVNALMDIDMVNDIRIYGPPGATVYDVTVESGIGESKAKPTTPPNMSRQAERYIGHIREYYASIVESYEFILRTQDKNPRLSPQLNQLITRAYADQPNNPKYKNQTGGIIRRTYKMVPLDEYRVVIKAHKKLKLNMGSKLTNIHGGKGVITAIMKDADMPMDEDGNIADVIKFSKSTVARLNPGQFYEGYVNAAARDMTKWIIANNDLFPYDPTVSKMRINLQRWSDTPKPNSTPIDVIWNRLLEYYRAACPLNYDIVTHRSFSEEDKLNHIEVIVKSVVRNFIPPDSKHLKPDIFRSINNVIKPTYGKIIYTDQLGRRVTTLDNAFIGIEQMIVLEKTEQHPMAVSTSPLQIHGLPAGPNKIARNGHPSKVQAPKSISETEGRLYSATMGEEETADMLAVNNSPEAHKGLVKAILRADKPTNMNPNLHINRNSSRPVVFVKSVLLNFGLVLTSTEQSDSFVDKAVSWGNKIKDTAKRAMIYIKDRF